MYINDESVECNTSESDNLVLLPRDRELLDSFHQLSEVKQKACIKGFLMKNSDIFQQPAVK